MAWVTVPGTNGVWEYDNAPTLGVLEEGERAHPDDQYYRDAPGADNVVNGVRSWTTKSGTTREVYVKCRKTSNPKSKGDLDKTYYDART